VIKQNLFYLSAFLCLKNEEDSFLLKDNKDEVSIEENYPDVLDER